MESLFYPIIFFLGICVGSFLNSVIYRLQTGENFLVKRSHCPHCKHILCWKDLIPLISFLSLKGKCRYCQKSISWQYPLVETTTGLLFLLIFNFLPHQVFGGGSIFNFQKLLFTIYYLLITCFLIIIFVYDLKHYIIPDKVIYPAIGIVFLYRLFGILNFGFDLTFDIWILDFKTLMDPLTAAFAAGASFLFIVLISKGRWMGFGDVKLAFFMGLLLGFPKILIALFLAFFSGALIGLILILLGKKTLKSKVPFAPFLAAGTFLSFFFGETLLSVYQSFYLL